MSTDKDFLVKARMVLEKMPESRHSYFQLKYFVVGKEPTNQSRMWSCLRQLESKVDNIENISLEIEETKDQLDLLDIKKQRILDEAYVDDLAIQERKIRIRQVDRQKHSLLKSLNKLENSLKYEIQEARFYLMTFEAIEIHEPLKDYDDLESQKEYWNEKLASQVNLKMLLQQPLDIDLVQTVLALPKDSEIRAQLDNSLKHVGKQMESLKQKYIQKIELQNQGE